MRPEPAPVMAPGPYPHQSGPAVAFWSGLRPWTDDNDGGYEDAGPAPVGRQGADPYSAYHPLGAHAHGHPQQGGGRDAAGPAPAMGQKRRFEEHPRVPRQVSLEHTAGPLAVPSVATAAPPAWHGGGAGSRDRNDPYHQYYTAAAALPAARQPEQRLQIPQGGRGGAAGGRGAAAAVPPAGATGPGAAGRPVNDGGLDFLASRPSAEGAVYTRLTQNIAAIVRRLDPTPEELSRRRHVLRALTLTVASTFPEYRNAQVRS